VCLCECVVDWVREWVCCVCVCVCARARARERESNFAHRSCRLIELLSARVCVCVWERKWVIVCLIFTQQLSLGRAAQCGCVQMCIWVHEKEVINAFCVSPVVLCMYVYTCDVCVIICIYIYTSLSLHMVCCLLFLCTYVYTYHVCAFCVLCVDIYLCLSMHVYAYMCLCMYIHICVCTCIYICEVVAVYCVLPVVRWYLCVCMHIHKHTCVYACIYTYATSSRINMYVCIHVQAMVIATRAQWCWSRSGDVVVR